VGLKGKRYSWAFSAGSKEHWARKVLGVLLIAVSIYLLLDGGSWQGRGLEYLWYAATLLWIFGWLFHKLERWLHPG